MNYLDLPRSKFLIDFHKQDNTAINYHTIPSKYFVIKYFMVDVQVY